MLLVEDSEDDAALVLLELKRGGYDVNYERVETPEAFKRALGAEPWDVIVSDHSMPRYGGFDALADLQASSKDTPFILISGTIGEAIAVKAIKAGAQDYVLKGDLTRLPVAIEREVRDAAVRVEQAKIRERLVISERMASAGTLAAGVAHEINNPLAIAMINMDMTTDAVARIVTRAQALAARGSRAAATLERDAADLRDGLADTREALQRIRDIVRDVKVFSRPDDETTGTVDLRRVADSSARMARNEIRHRARLVTDYGEIPMVHANESRLGQVLLNLLVNAAQAIPEGHADANEIHVAAKTGRDGDAVVEVSDTGSGIPKEMLSRIFDPFYTTKPIGVGTGLGLAICHGIVSELGGRIEVESEVGKGSLFRLVLPAARESPTLLKATAQATKPEGVRVLIVDDEVALGRALKRSLSAHHDVKVLSSGAEALACIAAGERFDAILLDVMMPDVSGNEAYERLLRDAPDQAHRVIFLTGGAFSPSAREFLDRVPNPRLEKPADPVALLSIIEQLTSR